jgi:hypothetical protein
MFTPSSIEICPKTILCQSKKRDTPTQYHTDHTIPISLPKQTRYKYPDVMAVWRTIRFQTINLWQVWGKMRSHKVSPSRITLEVDSSGYNSVRMIGALRGYTVHWWVPTSPGRNMVCIGLLRTVWLELYDLEASYWDMSFLLMCKKTFRCRKMGLLWVTSSRDGYRKKMVCYRMILGIILGCTISPTNSWTLQNRRLEDFPLKKVVIFRVWMFVGGMVNWSEKRSNQFLTKAIAASNHHFSDHATSLSKKENMLWWSNEW